MASALSQRRFLSETTSYTYAEGNGFDLITRGDAFINSPDLTKYEEMLSLGVEYVLIDKRESFSPLLSNWGTVLLENESGLLLELSLKNRSSFLKNNEFIPN
jgi:hypothetical protein